MKTFLSSFFYAGGPIFLFCFILGWAPYFYNSKGWNDSNFDAPIRLGLSSSIYTYTLVAGVSASFPTILELIFHTIASRQNLAKGSGLILANMLLLVFPELISLIIVSPTSDSKIYILLLNNQIGGLVFVAIMQLSYFSKKSWKCKYSTLAVSFIYVGLLSNSLVPYFNDIMELWIQNMGIFLQFIGCIIIIFKSYIFLRSNSVPREIDNLMIVDYLLCKFTVISLLFVIFGMFFVYICAGFPTWTQWNSTYISCYNLILALPNIIMGVVFARATRNEYVNMQHAKQMFINYISHEMRTPLNTAVMGLQYLRSELVKVQANDEIMLTLEEIRSSCDISVNILSEMLDYDKIKSGLMKMEYEEISFKELLEETISPFYIQAGLKDIVLECNLNDIESHSLLISVDKSKFAQVIRNLLSNAIKFTPFGGTVTIATTTITLPLTPSALCQTIAAELEANDNSTPSQQELLTIKVTDTGAGISKENQKKLFKEMVQFNPGKLQSGGGTGLGLYISKGIMDLLHGTLSVESEGEGHGSTFTITIPAKYVDNTINLELPEIKVNEEEFGGVDIHLNRLESTKSTRNSNSIKSNNDANNNYNNDNSVRAAQTTLRVLSNGRLSNSSRSSNIKLLSPGSVSGSTKVTPLLKSDSFRSMSHTSSVCRQNSQEESYDETAITGLNILIVDDSKSNRKMLVRLLRDKCAVIGEAVDGVDAVNQIKEMLLDKGKTQFNAILLDFIMPNMEGPEAAREIRELGYIGLIIGITGNVLQIDKDRFISNGVNLVLTKPVNIGDIIAAFNSSPYSNYKLGPPSFD